MGKVAERYFASGMTLSKKELDEIRKSEVKNSKPAPPTSSDA
jgi:hypothetical protein